MKKILIIVTLLVAIANMLLAEDMQLQEISLDEFLNNHLVDYKIEKQIQLEGIGRNFAVAEDTGEIVAVTKTDEKTIVQMLDLEGNCKWSHSFDNNYHIIPLVSKNGNTATLFFDEGEGRGKNVIISKEGHILYKSPTSHSVLYPSPDGNYVYGNINLMGSSKQKEIIMYDKYGKRINVTGLENYQIANIRMKFVDNSHLIAFIEQENTNSILLCFCEFNVDNLTVLWQYELKEGYTKYFDTHNMATTNLGINQNKIAVNAGDSGFFIFDFTGNILYQNNELISSFGFSQESSLIIKGKEIITFFDNNFVSEKNIDFSFGKVSADEILSFLKFDNFYLIDMKKFYWQKLKHHTLFYENDEIIIINEKIHYLSLNNSNIIIALSYEPTANITILREIEK